MEIFRFEKRWVKLALTLVLVLSSFVAASAEQMYEGKQENLYINGLDPCQLEAVGRMELKSNSTLNDPDRRRTSMAQLVATIVGSECPGTHSARIDFLDGLGDSLGCLIASRTNVPGAAWQVKECAVPAKPFGMMFWLELLFVFGLISLAFAVFRWANSVHADAWLQLPTSISSIAQVLFDLDKKSTAKNKVGSQASASNQGLVVLAGDEISLRFKVRVYPGVFRHEGSLARCVITHVPVPPGMIARVETQSGSVSMDRILDTGRVLTIKDENLNENWVSVLALERSARWQVSIKSGIKTGDDYLVRLHIAVHSWIFVPSNDPAIERVFEEYSSYRTEVARWVRHALEGILLEQTYDQSMRHCDEIVDSLNRQWRNASATRISKDLQGAIGTRFTALVIKPRQEAEATRFRPIFNRIHVIEQDIKDTNARADYQIKELDTRIENALREMHTYIGNLDGLELVVKDNKWEFEQTEGSFATRLENNAKAVGQHFDRGAERTQVHKITVGPFDDARSMLTKFGKNYVDACSELSDLIRQVRAEQRYRLNSSNKHGESNAAGKGDL